MNLNSFLSPKPLLALTALTLSAWTAHAQVVVTLTSGDATGGFDPLANVADAFALGTSTDAYTPVSIQGVTFAKAPTITSVNGTLGNDSTGALATGITAASAGFTTPTDTNTTNLLSVLGGLEYAGSSALYTGNDVTQGHGEYTITGLTLGTTYQVDLFEVNYGNSTTRQTLYQVIGGVTLAVPTGIESDSVLALNSPQLAEFDITPDASGDITINYGAENNNGLGLLSAVAVTYAAPEPSTWALMFGGLGMMLLCVLNRRRFSV